MRLSYDPEADGLMVRLAEGQYYESAEVHPGFTLDFDKDGRVLGFEVLPASQVLGPGAWSQSGDTVPTALRRRSEGKGMLSRSSVSDYLGLSSEEHAAWITNAGALARVLFARSFVKC